MNNEQFQEFVVKHLLKLTDKVSSVEDRLTSVEGSLTSVENKLTSVEERLTSVEGTVLRIETRMENEVIDKIKILFDGHQQHETKIARIEKKFGVNM